MNIGRLLILFLTTGIACVYSDKGDFVEKERLIGRYVYQENKSDTIDLNSDGTYSFYKWSNDRKLENSGTWIHDSESGRVDFDNFSFLTDTTIFNDSTFLPRGHWRSRIEFQENEIRLRYAREIYQAYFLKVDTVDRKKVE